jgi:hypothetical protein
MVHPDDDDFLPMGCYDCEDCYGCKNVDCKDHPDYKEHYGDCYDNYDDPMFDDLNPCDFRDPGGRSALRNGPRIHPCPNCGEPNKLSTADKIHGYQCDDCANQIERGW